MSVGVANVLQANMEKVRPGTIPALYELVEDNTLYRRIKKRSEKEMVTDTVNGATGDFRIPLKVRPGGQYGAMNLDGGAFAPGSSAKLQQMFQQYFTTQLAYQLTIKQIRSTGNSNLSVFNAWKDAMREAPKNLMRYQDVSLHNITGNQGLVALGTAVSATGTAAGDYVYTFDYEFGANLLQEGMPVEIFDNTLATHKTTGLTMGTLPFVSGINHSARTATVTVQSGATLGTATAATDYLALPGVGATPAWMNGVYYFHSTATTGNLLGLSRATYPQLITPSVDAGGTLAPIHFYLLKARIRQRTGEVPAASKYLGVITDANAATVAQMGIDITQYNRSKRDTIIDPVPAYDDEIVVAGVTHIIDVHASNKRIDWFNLSNWGRVFAKDGEPDFYREDGSGKMVFTVRDGNGNPTAAVQFFMTASENFYNTMPGEDGFIYNVVPDQVFRS